MARLRSRRRLQRKLRRLAARFLAAHYVEILAELAARQS